MSREDHKAEAWGQSMGYWTGRSDKSLPPLLAASRFTALQFQGSNEGDIYRAVWQLLNPIEHAERQAKAYRERGIEVVEVAVVIGAAAGWMGDSARRELTFEQFKKEYVGPGNGVDT